MPKEDKVPEPELEQPKEKDQQLPPESDFPNPDRLKRDLERLNLNLKIL
jgi:hypothetical protein